ncbi:hypothetical protein AB1N83_007221 [Pleurotus pulmonarius]
MLPTLPWEIWSHIASYLSKGQLETLYSVNRPLYEISLNARYKTLRIKYADKRIISRLRTVRDTVSIAGRVQDLNIDIWSLASDRSWTERSTRLQRLGMRLRRLNQLLSTGPTKHNPSAPKLLLEAVNKMNGLRSVYFDLYCDASERHLQMVDCIWSILSGRVESLSIRLWGSKTHFVCPMFSNILGIKHLSVTLRGAYRSDGVALGVASIINAASASLESFHLEISGMSPSDSSHEIFERLYPFPRLKCVHFAFCGSQAGSEAVTFLNAHGEGLEELRLSAAGVVPFSVSALHLPMLHKLSADWSFCCNWNDDIQPGGAVINFPMLDCLRITGTCNKGQNITSFCDMFKLASGNGLRRLELLCESTDAEAFDHLAEAFPNLHTLILRTTSLSNPSGSYLRWDVESFAAEMENRNYSAWSLYDLEIAPVARPFGGFRYPWYEVMKIVASRIPSVRSFCGSGHMDSPNNAE